MEGGSENQMEDTSARLTTTKRKNTDYLLYRISFFPTFLFCTTLFPCVYATCSQQLFNNGLKYTLVQQYLICKI